MELTSYIYLDREIYLAHLHLYRSRKYFPA